MAFCFGLDLAISAEREKCPANLQLFSKYILLYLVAKDGTCYNEAPNQGNFDSSRKDDITAEV